MSIDVTHQENFCVVKPDFVALDVRTAGDLRSLFNELTAKHQHIVLDLQQVSYMDSTGIATLYPIRSNMDSKGGTFRVTGLNERVRSLFQLVGADQMFEVFDNVDDAIKQPVTTP